MQLTIALPGLIWPNALASNYLYAQLKLPNFKQLIKRATFNQLNFNYSDLIYSCINYTATGSLANYFAQKLKIKQEFPYFLLAEPTNLRADRDRLLISEPEILGLYQEEAKQIIKAINQHFFPHLKLYYITANLWLIGLTYNFQANQWYPVLDIIGQNIDYYLPSGNNAIHLISVLNEIQMFLFNLSLNQNRQNRGLIPINNLWLWDKQVNSMLAHQFKQIFLTHNLFNLVKPIDSLDNNLNLSHSNAKIRGLSSSIETDFQNNNLIIIDKLYYPYCYCDSHSWVENLQNLDTQLGTILLKWVTEKKIKQLDLLIPMAKTTLSIQIKSWDKYKFWQNTLLHDLIKGLE